MVRFRASLAALALGMVFAGTAVSASRASTTTVTRFEPPTLPEGLAVDALGTAYVGIATRGDILRIAADGGQSTLATLRPGLGSLLGLAVDAGGYVVAALASNNSPRSDRHGIWRVRPNGSKEIVAELPPQTMPNGLAYGPDGALFVSDSARGSIWRIGTDGAAAPWLQHELLDGDLQACPPRQLLTAVGPNGLAFEPGGSLLVASTTRAQIVRVPV